MKHTPPREKSQVYQSLTFWVKLFITAAIAAEKSHNLKNQNKMSNPQTTINAVEIEVNGIPYVQKSSVQANQMAPDLDGKEAVLIRAHSSGVHYGYIDRDDNEDLSGGLSVKLYASRRVHYWDGAASLSQMALEGVTKPKSCRISVVVPEITVMNVIEIIPLSAAALSNLNAVPVWRI